MRRTTPRTRCAPGGAARCIRLAYREDHKKLAVGVVLTSFMIAHVLEQDRVREIDFGTGRDEYKSGWMRDAREYDGFIAFNPWTPLGILFAFRHIQGRRVKRLIQWGLGVVRRERLGKAEPSDAIGKQPTVPTRARASPGVTCATARRSATEPGRR